VSLWFNFNSLSALPNSFAPFAKIKQILSLHYAPVAEASFLRSHHEKAAEDKRSKQKHITLCQSKVEKPNSTSPCLCVFVVQFKFSFRLASWRG
jgi:hypothetical protein